MHAPFNVKTGMSSARNRPSSTSVEPMESGDHVMMNSPLVSNIHNAQSKFGVSVQLIRNCRKSPAERLLHIKVRYPAVTICNQASRTILSDRLLQRIHQLNHKWNICEKTANEDTCSGAKVTVNCASDADDSNSILARRHRRQNDQTQMFSVQLDVPVKRANEMKPVDGKQMDPMEIIQSEVLLKEFLNLEQVLPNGRPDLNSFVIENEFKCQEGEVNVEDSCVPCAAGSAYNVKEQRCEQCKTGSYQPSQGKLSCLPCAQNGVTTGAGAVSVDECKRKAFIAI